MKTAILNRLAKEDFLPTRLSLFVNPFYILRSGLYNSINQISDQINGNILDFGCGSKPYEGIFRNATTYVGVDIEKSGHNHTTSKIDFFYDGVNLPFPDESFDAVVSFEVFEHIFDLEHVLSEIFRVLKPNGKLLITIPFAWEEHEIPYDFARYTNFGMSHILEKNKFKIIQQNKTTTYFEAICQIFIAYIFLHVIPKGGWKGLFWITTIIFPLNLLVKILNYLAPKRFEYYCNLLILSQKIGS